MKKPEYVDEEFMEWLRQEVKLSPEKDFLRVPPRFEKLRCGHTRLRYTDEGFPLRRIYHDAVKSIWVHKWEYQGQECEERYEVYHEVVVK